MLKSRTFGSESRRFWSKKSEVYLYTTSYSPLLLGQDVVLIYVLKEIILVKIFTFVVFNPNVDVEPQPILKSLTPTSSNNSCNAFCLFSSQFLQNFPSQATFKVGYIFKYVIKQLYFRKKYLTRH